MYVLAHTWRAVDEQRCATVLAKTGAAVRLSRMQVQLAVQTKGMA